MLRHETIYIGWTGAGIVALGLLPVGFGAGLSLGVIIGELFFDHTAVTNFAFALGCFTSIVLTYVVGKMMNRYGNTHALWPGRSALDLDSADVPGHRVGD